MINTYRGMSNMKPHDAVEEVEEVGDMTSSYDDAVGNKVPVRARVLVSM